MSKRLDSLRSQLVEIEARRNAAHARSLELAERDDDLTEVEADELRTAVKTFHDLGPDADGLRAEINSLEAVLAAPAQAREVVAPTIIVRNQDDPFRAGAEFAPAGEVRSTAFRAIEQVRGLDDHHRESAEHLVRSIDMPDGRLARHIILTGRDAYRSAFQKMMAGRSELLADAERQALIESRASSLVDADGGYAVPFTLDASVIHTATYAGAMHAWRQLATVTPVVTDNWNGVSSAGVTASMVGEMDEATDGSPTLSQVSIAVKKAHAFVRYTEEIYADWASYEAEIRSMFTWAKEVLEDSQFTLGSGTGNNVNGLVTDLVAASTPIVASAGANAFAAADVYALEDALAKRFRAGASFLAARATFNKVRQFDTSGGSALWERIGAGMPPELIGYPIYEAENMDSTYGSGENYIAVFGDIAQAYRIIDRVGMTIQNFPALMGATNNLPNGTGGLRLVWRFGAKTVNTTAAKVLNIT
jgi:HK97 family phage major capsid protein